MPSFVTYTTHLSDNLHLDAGEFFEGWPKRPSTEQFRAVLAGSHRIVLAVDDKHVIGFVNAISDGVLTAFIPWLEVLPEYRSHGVGSTLVRKLLTELDNMYSVDLTCDPHLEGFYKRLGLTPLTGMAHRNPTVLHS